MGKGWKRPKRLYKLGEDYTNERIMERIRENSYAVKFSRFAGPQKTIPVYRLKGTLNGAKKIGGLRGLYLHYCYKLGILPNNRKQTYARDVYKRQIPAVDSTPSAVLWIGEKSRSCGLGASLLSAWRCFAGSCRSTKSSTFWTAIRSLR